MAKSKPEWEQLPLFERGNYGMKEGSGEEWRDQQWEADRRLAMVCIQWLRNARESYLPGKSPGQSEEKIANATGQFHEYVHRRLMSAWRRKVDPGLVKEGRGYWSYRLAEDE